MGLVNVSGQVVDVKYSRLRGLLLLLVAPAVQKVNSSESLGHSFLSSHLNLSLSFSLTSYSSLSLSPILSQSFSQRERSQTTYSALSGTRRR